ncbi:MAG TPA: LacI family DNA-binding transcriptional regulator [Chthoniobacteraceae bacterium]|nr:LacI family DNA-binding transcriptional regulator [Chthoniobacteraceae bacterium]
MAKVTQTDIAQALGLSPATVGLVVGDSKSPLRQRLSKETVRRVQEKAEEMGYLPNRAAQTMRKGRTNLIVLLNMSGHSEIGGKRSYEIGKRVQEAGFDYQIVEAYFWPGDGKRIIEQVIALRPEGIIATGSIQTTMDFGRIHRARIPMVAVDMEIPGCPHVRHDVRSAVRELTLGCLSTGKRHLVQLLRKSPLEQDTWQLRERMKGFTEALEASGWEPPRKLRLGEPLRKTAAESAVIVLNERKSTRFEPFEAGTLCAGQIGTLPDALLCANDDYAIGALTYYQRAGIAVPREVALSGFDNLSYTTQGSIPITTVEQPIAEVCRAAVEMLEAKIRRNDQRYEELIFPCRVIWRASMPNPRQTIVPPLPSNPPLP